ncbi:MAG: hypothetical protein JNL98_22325 [Bryobacterales bacterium]|nr:hypothetical protein [Bryobacterales bacterium]
MPHLIRTIENLHQGLVNLDDAVGKDCPNLEGDVRLIQYMLQRLYSQSEVRPSTSVTASWMPLRQPLTCNGDYDLPTRLSIFRFQIDLGKRYGIAVLIDGILTPSLEPNSPLAQLNRIYELNFPQDYARLLKECGSAPPCGAVTGYGSVTSCRAVAPLRG